MHSINFNRVVGGLALLGLAAVACADEARVLSPDAMQEVVSADIVSVGADGLIHGRLTNRSDARVQAAQVVARYAWLWKDVRHPPGENPGWVVFKDIPTALEPRQTVEFTVDPGRALPERDDGRLMPSLAVVRVTEFRPAPTR